MASFVSREEYRAQKALDEARKAGAAPAAVDEEGKEINPHMPQYITTAPWYLNQYQPSLKHQRMRDSNAVKVDINKWYTKGRFLPNTVTKFRKGACTNCGSITHTAKFCCDRPRKVGAKYSGKDFGNDEVIEEFELNYDAKRDRWNGYDPDTYKHVIEEYNKLEEAMKQKKAEELKRKLLERANRGEDALDDLSESEEEEQNDEKEKAGESNAAQFVNKDPRIKTTTRNLRIREDIAKYLRNLNPESAYYDGKSRSMRDNPNPNLAENQ